MKYFAGAFVERQNTTSKTFTIFRLLALILILSCESKTDIYDWEKAGQNASNTNSTENTIKKKSLGNYDLYHYGHGGIDYIEDGDRFHAVTLTHALDIEMGGYRYHLTYFWGDNDNHQSRVLKNTVSKFFPYSFYRGDPNFIRLIKVNEKVIIYYRNESNQLMEIILEEPLVERVVAAGVGAFDVAVSDTKEIGIVYQNTSTYDLKLFYKKRGHATEQLESSYLQDVQSQLSLNYSGDTPVISLVAKHEVENTNIFYIYQHKSYWERTIIARGLPKNAHSNSYISPRGILHSCYINTINERYSFSFDLGNKYISHKKIKLEKNRYDYGCFVSPWKYVQIESLLYGSGNLYYPGNIEFNLGSSLMLYKIKSVGRKLIILGVSEKRFQLIEILD